MTRKPDIIRAVVIVFVIGLAVTGLTSLQASQDDRSSVQTPQTRDVAAPPFWLTE